MEFRFRKDDAPDIEEKRQRKKNEQYKQRKVVTLAGKG
jgi:hypothetical protein